MELIVKDNYLSQDKFDYLYNIAQKLQPETEMERSFFDEDPTPELKEYINHFTKKRSYRQLGKLIHINATPPNFDHPLHDEASFKIMSAVIYLGPEKSLGTTFYMDEEFVIEWRPNRLMIFCGETDVTWHDFKSGDHVRHTYNYFLCDPTKVQNETVKNSIHRL